MPKSLMYRAVVALALAFDATPAWAFAQLTPAASQAYDRYISLTESAMRGRLSPVNFLGFPPEDRAKLRAGQLIVFNRKTTDQAEGINVPGGQIQDWVGEVFIPGATVEHARAVMTKYENYKELFAPEIIDSKLLSHQGDRYRIFLRLYRKQVLTIVLNSEYEVRYVTVDPDRYGTISHSTRIAQVKDPKRNYDEEYPPGDDLGILWRLNTYWRYEQADGGVYARCEAISLSRDVPFGLGFLIRGIIDRFPKESMDGALRAVKRALAQP